MHTSFLDVPEGPEPTQFCCHIAFFLGASNYHLGFPWARASSVQVERGTFTFASHFQASNFFDEAKFPPKLVHFVTCKDHLVNMYINYVSM